MLTLFLLVAATPAAQSAKPVCRPTYSTPIDARQRGRARPLGAEPPARQIYAVLRTENGCSKPVPVNERRFGNR